MFLVGKKIEPEGKKAMKKNIMSAVLLIAFTGCTNGTLDEGKLNAAGDKLQKTVEKGADSIAAKVDRFADSLKRDSSDTPPR